MAAVVLTTAVFVTVAACTGSTSGSSNTSTTSSAQSGASPSGTSTAGGETTQGSNTSAGGATSGATTSAAGSNSGSAASAHAANGVSPCTGAQLKVTLGRAGAAGGHAGQPLVFTNTSSQTCTMQGYPGAAIMNGSTVVLNATRILNGYIGDERQLSSVPLVTLAPGANAAAMLEYDVDNSQTCYASGSGTLRVTPPNTTVTTSLSSLTAGPDGVCSGFEIHPVVPGTLS